MTAASDPAATAATPTAVDGDLAALAGDLAQVRYNADGLVPAIVQDRITGRVLMMAWMNRATLGQTLTSGRTVFWSRSRQEVWRKGETSGDRQWVREARYDCDGDTLLFVVDQEGMGACHTGAFSCFFRSFGGRPGGASADDGSADASPADARPAGASPADASPADASPADGPGTGAEAQ